MAGFEDLIRGTLRKHGDSTPEARAAIYQSSRQALERMLGQNESLDSAARSMQRQRLEDAIADIEAGYLARPVTPMPPAQPAQPAQTTRPAQSTQSNPPVQPAQPTAAPPRPQPAQPAPPAPPRAPAVTPTAPTQAVTPPPPPRPAPPPTPRMQPAPEPRVVLSERDEIRVDPGVDVPPIPVPPAVTAPSDRIGVADQAAPAPASYPDHSAVPPPSPLPSSPPVPEQSLQPTPPPVDEYVPVDEADEVYEPEIDTRDAYSEAYAAVASASASRERKPYAKLLLWTIILVGIGVAIWWAFNFGTTMIQQRLGGSVPNPGQTIESGEFVPGREEQWVTAFNPGDDSVNIESGGRGIAEIFQNETDSFVRLASNAGGGENILRILIPRGVMLPLKGEAVTVEVQIKSAAKTNHQFAVYCDFGDMGNCGRKRFTAADRVESQLFDVLLNNAELAPNEDAYLEFNTDLAGEGRAVDIYAIRLRPNS